MIHENAIPDFLYKIVSEEGWKKSLETRKLVLPAMDDGFIHLATEQQVAQVAEKYWSGLSHIVLKINSKELIGRLSYETNPGGTTKYFHLYDGAIPLSAIEEATVVPSRRR